MGAISNIRRGRAEKLSALGASLAINIARSKNDPLYKKYEQFREKFLQVKQMIIKKYGRAGMKEARTAMAGKTASPSTNDK